ncbi:excisionase family protein [Serratia fonticola]|uniref:excisionase family protein n=1 Tax=Serratia fonticola TaxID=47917 RepID=UPI001FD75342|nr:excisionase family protein [Serratia fonticola]
MAALELSALQSMSAIIVQPNDWITKEHLMLVTGLTDGKIRAFRRKGAWRQGKEWILVSTDGCNKPNSDTMYHLPTINAWFTSQRGHQPTE